MMNSRIWYLSILSASLVLTAHCAQEDENYLWLLAAGSGGSAGGDAAPAEESETPFSVDVSDVNGEEEFLFNNTRTIPVFITVRDHLEPVSGSLVQVLEIGDGGGSQVIFQAASSDTGNVTGSFTINRATEIVRLKFTYQGQSHVYEINIVDVLEIHRTIFVTADLEPIRIVDTDGDGIPDDQDAFPGDPSRAATVRVPSESYYTVAFEDLYPRAGDADFNDYVLRVYHEEDLDAAGRVTRIRGFYTHIAKGAGYNHTLHLNLPGDPAGGYTLKRFDADGNLEVESTEQLSALRGIEVLPSSNTTIARSNTATGQSLQMGKRAELELVLDTPADRSTLGAAPYDLYLYVKNTGHEIHFLGRYFDADGRDLYLDENGFPWALLIPGDWRWPYERRDIHDGYDLFDDWYMSAGESFKDWYMTADEAFVFPLL